jgi:hypothetical protein
LAITVLLILAAMWAAVLLPPVLRARTVQRTGDTIGDFRYRLGVLGNRTGRRQNASAGARGPIDSLARLQAPAVIPGTGPVADPRNGSMSPMQRRRRDILLGLAGATSVTFFLAVAMSSAFAWFMWLVSASALGVYVWLLIRMKQMRSEQGEKVRYLSERRPQVAPEPELALPRRAHS